uniref:DUF559 domain-containing protein n=1 Tax=viral metagenome TaxID=1070528 RepID=A0A6C0JM73_9ZZZZ
MSDFTRNLEELLYLSPHKHILARHLKKNYRENIHFIVEKFNSENNDTPKHGGHNKEVFKLNEKAFELFKNSFNLRNRYIVNMSDNLKMINVGMCIENQTIGFIENSFNGVLTVKRQYKFGKYRVDLYFVDYKLVIECDENNHDDRDSIKEKIREDYIISLGNKMIRYNPNTPSFDLSTVLRDINTFLFSKNNRI